MKLLICAFAILLSTSVLAEDGNDCFWRQHVNGFSQNERESVIIHVGTRDYKVQVRSCFELPWAEMIRFRTFPSNSNRVCRGDDLIAINFFMDIHQICNITAIDRID